jgi:ABC-type transport system substrate-binding protein
MRKCLILLAAAFLLPAASTDLFADSPGSGYYRRVLYSRPFNFDPISAGAGSEVQLFRQLFDQLISYDKDFRWKPMLASEWTISEGGKVYTFKLRKDVKFSDGTLMTPEDVVFSLKRGIREPDSRYFSDLLKIRGAVEYREGKATDVPGLKISGDKLIIESVKPNPYLMHVLARSSGSIIKRGYSGPRSKLPIGTGPFKLKCISDKEVVLEANKDYFLGASKLPGVVYYVYDNKEDAFKDFQAKKLDDMAPFNLPPGADRAGLKRVFTNGIISFVVVFNPEVPPLNNKYLRQALVTAVDFDAVLAKLGDSFPMLSRTRSHIPKGRVGYDPAFEGLGYDPVKAKELLGKAGYKDFSAVPPVKFLYTGTIPYTNEVVAGLREYYSKLGLRLEPQKVSGAEAVAAVDKGNWQMSILGTDWLYVDSYLMLSAFHSGSPVKTLTRNDKKLDALLDKCETEMNPAVRQEMFRQINSLLVKDAHVIPLYSGDMFDGTFQRWVEGIQYPNTAFFDIPMQPMSINPELARQRPARDFTCGK